LTDAAGPLAQSHVPPPDYDAGSTIRLIPAYANFPDRTVAEALIESYVNHVYPLFPVLHLRSLWRSFEKLSKKADSTESPSSLIEGIVFYSTSNMVFALGRLNSTYTKPESTMSQADLFHQRARHLLALDVIDKLTLEAVQYGSLTVQYLLSTMRANRCHIAVGIAIRYAQSLKLDASGVTASSKCSKEITKRVWHTCVMTERCVCVGFEGFSAIDDNQLTMHDKTSM
jgi:hypothetical protein